MANERLDLYWDHVMKMFCGMCGGAASSHTWQSQNQPILYSCLHYRN